MLIFIALPPSMVAKAVPKPELPDAPCSIGGIQPISLKPETVEDSDEVFDSGS